VQEIRLTNMSTPSIFDSTVKAAFAGKVALLESPFYSLDDFVVLELLDRSRGKRSLLKVVKQPMDGYTITDLML